MERFAHLWFLDCDSRWPLKRHGDKTRHRLCFRTVSLGFVLLAAVAIITFVAYQSPQVSPLGQPMLSLPTSMIPYVQLESHSMEDNSPAGDMFIEDVVNFSSEVMFLVRVPAHTKIPNKDRLRCRYGGDTHFALRNVLTVHFSDARAAVLCGAPPENLEWDVNSAWIEVDHDQEIRTGRSNPRYRKPLLWNHTKLVYEAFPLEGDVVLFAHGLNHTRGSELPEPARLKQYRCVFGGYYETAVISHAQEVFRCPHPPQHLIQSLAGKKITLKCEGERIATVAYYNPRSLDLLDMANTPSESSSRKLLLRPVENADQPEFHTSPKKHQVCSCTMIYNGAKFLKEWVYYNSYLGVEKFFLYDNNSEDNLDEVIASLESFNVTKMAWPWVKTQEAGFSHCAVHAEPECTWMLYTDIDEFLFPREQVLSLMKESASVPSMESAETLINYSIQPVHRQRSSPSALTKLIQEAFASSAETPEAENGTVGQVTFICRSFGPSGLTVSPPQGVTQGYTCRARKPERHKPVVLLGAVAESLHNVIHQFSLKPGYRTHLVRPPKAVINHYKYQVWDEFKTKFHRRAATYVADWTEDRKQSSRDRVPGLGTKPIKPANWEGRYCDYHDYGLRDYTRRIFGSIQNSTGHLAWE